MFGIYKIECLVDGKVYIGRSKNPKKRWYQHCMYLSDNTHCNKNLQKAWNKYGDENFKFSIIEQTPDMAIAIKREDFWMDETRCYYPEFGYNVVNCKNINYNRKKPDNFEKLVNIKVIAGLLATTTATIRKWIKNNLIPHYKIGRVYLFRISEVMNAVENITNKKIKNKTHVNLHTEWKNRTKVMKCLEVENENNSISQRTTKTSSR